MKKLVAPAGSLSLTLLLQAGLVTADQPFTAQQLERRPQASECRILEFNCATCGHITDDEQWDEKNRLISDVETCEKQGIDQPVIDNTLSTD